MDIFKIATLLISIVGLVCCIRWREVFDQNVRSIVIWCTSSRPNQELDDLESKLKLIRYLMAQIQGGISLESAFHQSVTVSDIAHVAFKAVKDPSGDPLYVYIHNAIQTGAPCLKNLVRFENSLRNKYRCIRKALAISAQARAQSLVLSFLPWTLVLALAIIDWQGFLFSTSKSETWLAWSFALLLTFLGGQWIDFSIKQVLLPTSREEVTEEVYLPNLVLALISTVAQGKDIQNAFERGLQDLGGKTDFLPNHNKLAQLRSWINEAYRVGAPLSETLENQLNDIYQENFFRWEERGQKLPIYLLAPLFICFLPASIVVLAGYFFSLQTMSLT